MFEPLILGLRADRSPTKGRTGGISGADRLTLPCSLTFLPRLPFPYKQSLGLVFYSLRFQPFLLVLDGQLPSPPVLMDCWKLGPTLDRPRCRHARIRDGSEGVLGDVAMGDRRHSRLCSRLERHWFPLLNSPSRRPSRAFCFCVNEEAR